MQNFNITYIHEPTDLQCGQAVLAMLSEKTLDEIIALCGTDRETKLCDMKRVLENCGIKMGENRIPVNRKEDLPPVCILSLETPRCWHWSLYAYGIFYDPEHGVMDDFPSANRKYYWEVRY